MKKIINIIVICILSKQLFAQCKNNTNTNPIDNGGPRWRKCCVLPLRGSLVPILTIIIN